MKNNFDEIIETALRTEPDYKPGLDFKENVLKLIRAKERKSQRKFYMLITVGITLMVATGVGVFLLYGGSLKQFAELGPIVPIAVLAGGLVVLIQYLDQKLVKNKLFKQLV